MCCVDMCWICHAEVLPRNIPAAARGSLYLARVNQNHFVPLLRSRQNVERQKQHDSNSANYWLWGLRTRREKLAESGPDRQRKRLTRRREKKECSQPRD